jgi:CBS domain-containing protein
MNTTIVQFLKTVHPFSQLPDNELLNIESHIVKRSYKAGELLYRHAHSSLRDLSIIASGKVEKYFLKQDGQKAFVEVFGEGDTFGAISILLNNKYAIRYVRTVEPTILYQLPDTYFLELCRAYDDFAAFYTEEFGRRMLSSGYSGFLLQKTPEVGGLDLSDHNFNRPVRDVQSSYLNTIVQSASIREAALSMSQTRRDYVLVRDESGNPMGIITDVDLREQVVINGVERDAPVTEVMSVPPLSIDGGSLCYEAILFMLNKKVKHLFVEENGQIVSVVRLEKLLGSYKESPFIYIRNIQRALDPSALSMAWAQTPQLVQSLHDRGVKSEIVNQIVTAISDAITHNLIEQAQRELGPAPAAFVFMALGSEGRMEQTLSTDQDNAIIYADVEPEKREDARAYFLELGKRVCDGLAAVGFSYCEGGLMAKNSKWTHSLSHWKKNYSNWFDEPFSDKILHVSTFFDCRTVYGESGLLEELKQHIFETLGEGNSLFFAQISRISLENKPPLTGWFKNFILTENDEGGKVLDIKKAMMPLADFARIFSLYHKISATNTGDRLRLLSEAGELKKEEFEELHQSYYFMMRLRLIHQANNMMTLRREPDNLIDPEKMTQVERVALKQIFKIIQKYQTRLGVKFTGNILK